MSNLTLWYVENLNLTLIKTFMNACASIALVVCVDMLAYDHLLDFIAHFDFIVDLASLGVHLT